MSRITRDRLATFGLTAAICFAQQSSSGDLLLTTGGTVDLPFPSPSSRVTSLQTNGSELLVVLGSSSISEVIVFDQQLNQRYRWSLPGRMELAALTHNEVVLGDTKISGRDTTFSVCRYSLDGRSQGHCASGSGQLYELQFVGDSVVGLGSNVVHEIDWVRGTTTKRPLVMVSCFGTPLYSPLRRSLASVDPWSGNARISNLDGSQSTEALLTSPGIAEVASSRHPDQPLFWKSLSWRDSELWVVPIGFKIKRGIPIVRFDRALKLAGVFALQVPAFDELIRPRVPGSPFANPTGHMVHDHLAALPSKLVVADSRLPKLVWYDLQLIK